MKRRRVRRLKFNKEHLQWEEKLSLPRIKKVKKELEKKIEGRVLKWAKKKKLEHRKMNGMGKNAWPDRQFFIPGGRPAFIEFKRLGGGPTRLQKKIIKGLRKDGYDVEVFDNSEEATQYLEGRMEAARLYEARRGVPSRTGRRRTAS